MAYLLVKVWWTQFVVSAQIEQNLATTFQEINMENTYLHLLQIVLPFLHCLDLIPWERVE
jgi:hypothetical protein